MNSKSQKELKTKILKNFMRLIESKPELMGDKELKEAYDDIKKKVEEGKHDNN